jgi:hypothetical protein
VISIERAIVLHLDDDADPAGGHLRGRAEHVVSGRSGRFESLAELLAFLDRVLRAARDDREDGS